MEPYVLRKRRQTTIGKFVQFTSDAITLKWQDFPGNRIVHGDDPSKFILVSFEKLRFPESSLKVTSEYIVRLMKAGLFLNGLQYRFYHHSNSQLRSRTCFFREANSDEELDARIYKLGDFGRIMNIAKRAKRIGLLFSAAEVDLQLDPKWVTDIDDITVGDIVFSDGCGLMAKRFAVQVSKAKSIIFRNQRYTPTVFQIRYLGYKGVLMLDPKLDEEKKFLVKFRKSMKKFSTTEDKSFSVVGYSQPYSFGRLNNDIVVLLSSLGISDEKFQAKQRAYFEWIEGASHDAVKAIDFLSSLGKYSLAERLLLDGMDSPAVSKEIRALQNAEVAQFLKNNRPRTRMIIHKSRLLYGVCDPYGVLKEGQVQIRITSSRGGATTPINGDILVVRNPCLHPGDCLKLRAVDHPSLSHLLDCIVFATVGRPGHQPAPAMSSGGDLDGDKFFVCWDPDLVPSLVHEPYDYPPNKERVGKDVTRMDLATYFASYNNMSLAKVSALHQKWVRSSPDGALCVQCQELNALHSQSVDGGRIKIPDRLLTPPPTEKEFILDILARDAEDFKQQFIQRSHILDVIGSAVEDEALVVQLLQSPQTALSEFEVFSMALSFARKHPSIDIRSHLTHLDFGALTSHQKYAISTTLDLSEQQEQYMWNSLMRSDILSSRDLEQRQLNRPLSMQRLYSSTLNSLATFFQYLHIASDQYDRKLLVLKTDDRFSVGIFIRGKIPWDEDPEVDDNVVVCSFMPSASSVMSTYRPCTTGYRLHCSDNNLQLYNKNRSDTFVFLTQPPLQSGQGVIASIALQKISQRVQKQLGRLNRTPVVAIEIHVISNRDRVAHQLFDLYFEHVQTEVYIGRFDSSQQSHLLKSLQDVDWEAHPSWYKEVFLRKKSANSSKAVIAAKTPEQRETLMQFCLQTHAEEELFWTFEIMISSLPLRRESTSSWIEQHPPLAFVLLKIYPPSDTQLLSSETSQLCFAITRGLIRSANSLGIATLAALERISSSLNQLPIDQYLDLLMLATLSIRPKSLVQEALLVLHECRTLTRLEEVGMAYVHKHALAVAFDCAEEAEDACPCNEAGRPRNARLAYPVLRLVLDAKNATRVSAHFRTDLNTPIRLHSHVRLQCVSDPQNGVQDQVILDGLVVKADKGEMSIDLLHPPPPETSEMQWIVFDAGSIATSKAMMDALLRLCQEKENCCSVYEMIVGEGRESVSMVQLDGDGSDELPQAYNEQMNSQQVLAVRSCEAPLSLIWGPPGT
ncbi:RNA-directed RNA polymerase [Serpula lacrymans var. lacrymans S7.9]|uniref:RNA-dependent RNA polymerase n=1 Tax=Serpula lacrymans var. lacrymans (strain S7.9) TaxID=578457 RepID=F8NID7_SERL9|nr:RNA-directed RNA polymerase [Serpula lacrymans var. lacrymans S7.9]EGO30084.1 RNA-directed RNA polymerase [Serpula lacrymans var. lacrymans S7.9]